MTVLKRYTGSAWEVVGLPATPHDHDAEYEPIGGGGSDIAQQTTAPGSPTTGDLWIDTDAVDTSGGSAVDSDQTILAARIFG